MARVFNSIRQRLLKENRFTRYLVYAIGEIVLVVIGILIALQINNWNEDRKHRARQVDLVNALILDLDLKMQENISDLGIGERILATCDKAMAAVTAGGTVDTADVVAILRYLASDEWYYTTTTPTYTSVVSSGLWQMLPDTIARNVQSIYDGRSGAINLGFEKHNEYATFCKLDYLAPHGLLDLSQDPAELASRISADGPAFLMHMEIHANGVKRMVRLNTASRNRIREVIPQLERYRDELASSGR